LKEKKNKTQQVDGFLNIAQLKGKKFDAFEYEEEDLSLATSNVEKNSGLSKLDKIIQLTGFSDPIYAEAIINLQHYDIILDLTIINQTPETMQNVVLELSTRGDLKLFDKPPSLVTH